MPPARTLSSVGEVFGANVRWFSVTKGQQYRAKKTKTKCKLLEIEAEVIGSRS